MKILSGHTSPETAYMVEDYPYGFRLRCKIRYWLESSPNKGVRFVSQTTNPKKRIFNAASGLYTETWNKPKASTYCRFGGAMFLNEENHVTWSGVTEYSGLQDLMNWKNSFYAGLPESFKTVFDHWLTLKTRHNEARARGEVSMTVTVNGVVTGKEVLQPEVIVPVTDFYGASCVSGSLNDNLGDD